MTDTAEKKLLTVPQVAERLAVSLSQAYKLIADEKLAHVRVSPRAVRVEPAALEDYIKSVSVGPKLYSPDDAA